MTFQRAPKEDIAESVEGCSAEAVFDLKRRVVLEVLGFDAEAATVTGRPHHRPPFAPLFARLLELPDPVVLDVVAIVMGETLQAPTYAARDAARANLTDMAKSLHRGPQLASPFQTRRAQLGLDAVRGKMLSQGL